MRKLLIIPVLFLTLMVENSAWGKWKKITEKENGTSYVEFKSIRQNGGYVYFWQMINYKKPSRLGDMSANIHNQGDCKSFRIKGLSWLFYKEPMGKGAPNNRLGWTWYKNPTNGKDSVLKDPSHEWVSPPPKSMDETVLKSVCAFVRNK